MDSTDRLGWAVMVARAAGETGLFTYGRGGGHGGSRGAGSDGHDGSCDGHLRTAQPWILWSSCSTGTHENNPWIIQGRMCKCGNKTATGGGGSRGVGGGGGVRGGAGVGGILRTIHDLVPQRRPPSALFYGLVVTSPCVWGATLWKILHTIAEFTNSPGVPEISREWRTLINVLPTCMPCPECAMHFQKWSRENPLRDPISRDDIRNWLLNLHNHLNVADGAAVFTPDMLTELYGGDKYVRFAALQQMIHNLRDIVGVAALNCMMDMIHKTTAW